MVSRPRRTGHESRPVGRLQRRPGREPAPGV